MHGKNIRATKQLVLLDTLDTLFGGLLGSQVLAPGNRLHIEGKANAGDRAAELAKAEQAERFAGDAVADAGLPAALAYKGVILGDPPHRTEDEAPGEFRGVVVAAAGATGAADRDALRLEC